MRNFLNRTLIFFLLSFLVACSGYVKGPDKQGEGMITGALTGAGAGAVTGFQVGAGIGPGAFVGAGIGAVAGSIQGAVDDYLEAENKLIQTKLRKEKNRARVQELLAQHYATRLDLFPTRDIFPADLFFNGDESKMCERGISLIEEISRMNKFRAPWSRLVVASYVKSAVADDKSLYQSELAERRSQEIGDYLAKFGLEPRRIEPRAVVVDAPVVIDPKDHPARYSHAVEFILADK